MSSYSEAQFDELLDKATRYGTVEGKRSTKRKIFHLISSGFVEPKYALNTISMKMADGDPRVVLLSIDILDSCVMVCGSLFQNEVATINYMERLKEVLETTPFENVKFDILNLIQTWAQTFQSTSNCQVIQDAINVLIAKGYEFPSLEERGAESLADIAVEQENCNCCFWCRIAFSAQEKKQQCTTCGKTLCDQCIFSFTLPELGIANDLICKPCQENLIGLLKANSNDGFKREDGENLFLTYEDENSIEADHMLARALSQIEADSNDGNDEVPDEILTGDLSVIETNDNNENAEETDHMLARALSEIDTNDNVCECLDFGSPVNNPMRNSESSTCMICCDRKVDTILVPCCHKCLCYDCAVEQWKGKGNGTCLLCREVIEDAARVVFY